jgi:hypothetical protein
LSGGTKSHYEYLEVGTLVLTSRCSPDRSGSWSATCSDAAVRRASWPGFAVGALKEVCIAVAVPIRKDALPNFTRWCSTERTFTKEELSKHCVCDDTWTSVRGRCDHVDPCEALRKLLHSPPAGTECTTSQVSSRAIQAAT